MPTTIETPPSTAALSAQEAAIAGRKYIKKKAVRRRFTSLRTFFSILLFTLVLAQVRAMAADLAGNVQGAGLPIAGSTVTLYAAGTGAPTQLAQGKTDDNGAFDLNVDQTPADTVLYLIAKGGTPKAAADKGPNDAIALMAVLGAELPKTVTVNELTTVASAFTAARFINGEAISGNPLGLRIAAGNVPNLVDPQTGGWGKVILDPLNSTQTTTLATLDTLGSLITASFTVANDDWRARFFKAATPIGGATPTNSFVEKSRSTIGSGPVDPPTLAGRAHPEQAFHRSAARVVVERSSTLVKAACMPRLTPPEALAVEVMAELVAEGAEEGAE